MVQGVFDLEARTWILSMDYPKVDGDTSIFNVLVTSTVQYRSLTSDKVVTRRPSLFFLQIHMKYYRLCHKCLCLSVPKDDWPGGADQRLPLSERVFASIRTYDLLSAFLSLKS